MNRTFIKQCTLLLLGLLTGFSTAQADEGMWMLNKLDKNTQKQMKEMGLQLSLSELYSPRQPSLKDAIVSFGGFCSGVVVSPDGLVFTIIAVSMPFSNTAPRSTITCATDSFHKA